MAHCCEMTTLPLPSTQSGAAIPVKTGVVATIRGILKPETLLIPLSRTSFAHPAHVPIETSPLQKSLMPPAVVAHGAMIRLPLFCVPFENTIALSLADMIGL